MSVVLIDDHPVLTLGLAMGLEQRGVSASRLEPAPPDLLVPQVAALSDAPDLIVMDLAMPQVPDTPELVAALTADYPLIILSGSDDRFTLGRCLVAGALGILSKNEPIESIIDEIISVSSGRPLRPRARVEWITEYEASCRERARRTSIFADLSSAERDVLALICDGAPAAQIAEKRFVSLPTVRTQIKSLMRKLDVTSQLEAVALAYRMGFVEEEQQSA